jgi:1,4-alpha-glucan branching enzyme
MPGDDWQKLANLRLLYAYQWGLPGKKLLMMGGEFGQRNEWDHEASLQWHLERDPEHAALRRWVRDLNALYRQRGALWRGDFDPGGFRWISCDDREQSVVSFVRWGHEQDPPLVFAFNFESVPRPGYRLGAPLSGSWHEALNGDHPRYGGSGVVNAGEIKTAPEPLHGFGQSFAVTLPPLGAVVLSPGAPPPSPEV